MKQMNRKDEYGIKGTSESSGLRSFLKRGKATRNGEGEKVKKDRESVWDGGTGFIDTVKNCKYNIK